MEAIGQLTGGVAHDFNNLMMIVLSNLERANRLIDDKEKCAKALSNARTATTRAATLTKQLLVFSRQQAVSPVQADVNAVLKEAAELSKNLLPDNLSLRLELEESVPNVKIDVNEAVNAVVNLIANARDAMPAGGEISLRSRVTAEHGNTAHVEVSVADSGCGMSPDVLEHAFEPFFTTKPVGQGSGLGLAQVYGFAKQAGGHAEISSNGGTGTRVTIYLPIEKNNP